MTGPDAAYFHTRLPIHGDGFLEIKIDVQNIAEASVADRQFILAVLDKMTAFALWVVPPQEAAKVKAPEVLRGVGGRP